MTSQMLLFLAMYISHCCDSLLYDNWQHHSYSLAVRCNNIRNYLYVRSCMMARIIYYTTIAIYVHTMVALTYFLVGTLQ